MAQGNFLADAFKRGHQVFVCQPPAVREGFLRGSARCVKWQWVDDHRPPLMALTPQIDKLAER
jgi:hypothetical protein